MQEVLESKTASAMTGQPLLQLSSSAGSIARYIGGLQARPNDPQRRIHSNLMESGVEFVAVDTLQADRFVVHIVAAVLNRS